MGSQNFSVVSFFLVITFLFLVFSLIGTFYQIGDQKYSLIGIQGSDTIGCLGSCQTSNNNCIGDDATPECQTVQALYIIATVLVAVCLIVSISCDLDTKSSFLSIFKRYLSVGVLSVFAMVLLLVSLIIATELPQGFMGGMPLSVFIKKDLVDPNDKLGDYKEGFFLTVFSIIFLFITSITGCSYN